MFILLVKTVLILSDISLLVVEPKKIYTTTAKYKLNATTMIITINDTLTMYYIHPY